MGAWNRIVAGSVLVAAAGAVYASPVVPGFVVSKVAEASFTDKIDVGLDGSLYFGQRGPGGSQAAVHPLMMDGSSRSAPSALGNNPIPDPDAIVVDIMGTVSGTQNNVIVGGVAGIFSIAQDGSVTQIYAAGKKVNNPTDFAFDASGRLVYTDWNNGHIRAIEASGTIVKFGRTVGRSMNLAFGADGSFYATDDRGNINFFASNGAREAVLAGNWTSIFVGNGSAAWGSDLYAVDTATGNLFRIGDDLSQTLVGSGFHGAFGDAAWGADGQVYITGDGSSKIFAIGEPIPAPASLALLGLGGLVAFRRRK